MESWVSRVLAPIHLIDAKHYKIGRIGCIKFPCKYAQELQDLCDRQELRKVIYLHMKVYLNLCLFWCNLKKKLQNHNDCLPWTLYGKLHPLDDGVHKNNQSLNGHSVEYYWILDLEKRSVILVASIHDWQILLNILSIVARHGKSIRNKNGFIDSYIHWIWNQGIGIHQWSCREENSSGRS